ncbi:hypothetical protein [Streptomyces sp. NPDC048565]|uniref:hypothetical protein n=1 Tax=Streptomyces sp. NPDC048565 TaxID=3155266 RepID=UPI003428A925
MREMERDMNPCCEDNRASDLVLNILGVLDDGVHVLTAMAATPDGPQITQAVVEYRPGYSGIDFEGIAEIVRVLAMTAGEGTGGLIVRSGKGMIGRRVFGWHIGDLVAEPIGSSELFSAYCSDPSTGEPTPPPPYTEYAKAPTLR